MNPSHALRHGLAAAALAGAASLAAAGTDPTPLELQRMAESLS